MSIFNVKLPEHSRFTHIAKLLVRDVCFFHCQRSAARVGEQRVRIQIIRDYSLLTNKLAWDAPSCLAIARASCQYNIPNIFSIWNWPSVRRSKCARPNAPQTYCCVLYIIVYVGTQNCILAAQHLKVSGCKSQGCSRKSKKFITRIRAPEKLI